MRTRIPLRTRLAASTGALLLTATMVSCQSADRGDSDYPATLTIGQYTLANPYGVAIEQGWFDDAPDGMRVEFIEMQSPSEGAAGLTSGDLDFALLGNPGVATALSQGVNLQVVWVYEQLDTSDGLLVQDGFTVDEAADLRGLTIGIVPGTTSQYALLGYLSSGGVSVDEVDMVELNASDLVAAYMRGDVDAGYHSTPYLTQMLESGGQMVVTSADVAELGYLTVDLAAVNIEFAQQYPEAVRWYLSVLDRTVAYYRDNPEETHRIMSNYLGFSIDEVQTLMDGLIYPTAEEQKDEQYLGGGVQETLHKNAVFWEQAGRIQQAASPEQINDAVTTAFLAPGKP